MFIKGMVNAVQVVYCRAFVARQTANANRQAHKLPTEEQAMPSLPHSQGSFHSDCADPEAQAASMEAAGEPGSAGLPSKRRRLSSWKRRAAAKARGRQDAHVHDGENSWHQMHRVCSMQGIHMTGNIAAFPKIAYLSSSRPKMNIPLIIMPIIAILHHCAAQMNLLPYKKNTRLMTGRCSAQLTQHGRTAFQGMALQEAQGKVKQVLGQAPKEGSGQTYQTGIRITNGHSQARSCCLAMESSTVPPLQSHPACLNPVCLCSPLNASLNFPRALSGRCGKYSWH